MTDASPRKCRAEQPVQSARCEEIISSKLKGQRSRAKADCVAINPLWKQGFGPENPRSVGSHKCMNMRQNRVGHSEHKVSVGVSLRRKVGGLSPRGHISSETWLRGRCDLISGSAFIQPSLQPWKMQSLVRPRSGICAQRSCVQRLRASIGAALVKRSARGARDLEVP